MILSCQSICKSFGEKVILQDASFHIEEREKAALIGNNGAGKTTLLRIIMHELSPDSGNVVLAKDKNIGYLAQYQDIHGHHTIYEELCFLLHMPIQSILRSCKSCKLRSIFLRKTIFICNCQKTFFNNIHTLVFFQILFFLSLSRLINSKFARFYKRCIHAMNWLTGACSQSDTFKC